MKSLSKEGKLEGAITILSRHFDIDVKDIVKCLYYNLEEYSDLPIDNELDVLYDKYVDE